MLERLAPSFAEIPGKPSEPFRWAVLGHWGWVKVTGGLLDLLLVDDRRPDVRVEVERVLWLWDVDGLGHRTTVVRHDGVVGRLLGEVVRVALVGR